ncbi:hypothetical protein C8R46DRAFT_682954 [Mycena filopes]|nr:hypothetical protein C8R46DRAFT_682954 [Mycena filopes]
MDSPFASVLDTNFVPSEAECGQIRDFIQPSQEEAAALTSEITRLTDLLNERTLRRDMLNKSVDSHLALVTPARRLPEDIIREIFLACIVPLPWRWHHPGMSTKKAPLLLCQICSTWRRVALSTPRLWSSLHINVLGNSKMAELASAATTWLSRSGILPLSISVESPYTYAPEVTDASPLLASLAAFSGRWKDIELYAPHSDAFIALSYLSPQEDVPLLQTLSIGSCIPDVTARWSWEFLPLMAAPSLRSLTILDAEIFTFTQLPRTLTALEIRAKDGWDVHSGAPAFATADALAVMQHCSALQSCTLEICAGDLGFSTTTLSFPQLSNFAVTNMTTTLLTVERLFAHLDLPKLDSLTYTYWIEDRLNYLPTNMFYPSLRSLTLDVEALDSTSLADGLRLLPHLTTLELNNEPLLPAGSTDFLTLLSSEPGGRPEACPNLHHVQLWNLKAVSDSALLAFIQARTAPERAVASRLVRTVARFLRPKGDADILETLGPLVAAGFDLALSYSILDM